MIRLVWHMVLLGHSISVNRTPPPPPEDLWLKGWQYECECGETYAK